MNIKKDHKETVVKHCRNHNYGLAKDFLVGLKSVYHHANPSLRSAYYLDLARCSSMLGDYDDADKYFDLTLGSYPNFYAAKLAMVESYLQRGTLVQAQNMLIELADITLEKAGQGTLNSLNYLMGNFFKLTGDYKESAKCYRKIDFKPGDKVDKGLRFVDQAQEEMAGIVSFAIHLRMMKRDMGAHANRDLSVIFLNNRIKESHSSAELVTCHSLMSRFHLESNDTRRARPHIDAGLRIRPDDPHITYAHIMCALQENKIPEARIAFRNAILDPCLHPERSIDLAQMFVAADQTDIAAELATLVIESETSLPSSKKAACSVLKQVYQHAHFMR